jgi:hypothetical protein
MKKVQLITIFSLLIIFNSCKKVVSETSETMALVTEIDKAETKKNKLPLSKNFNEYWYSGEAEISSYKLEQARYGEIRDGKAVLVYVTEDFLPEKQVKANNYSDENVSVLKLNATKNFNTGIYPYSIIQSTFYPVSNNSHALKISASIQEWCGHVYTQLNNRDLFEIRSHSYFQNEADQSFKLKKTWTENELWTKLRIDPSQLPQGEIEIIPSLEFLNLKHEEKKAYKAYAVLESGMFTLSYSNLNRTLRIKFSAEFPHIIEGWEESTINGYGNTAKTLTTKATLIKTIKSVYWNKNQNSDEVLRQSLELE